jgi:hypothetical protein
MGTIGAVADQWPNRTAANSTAAIKAFKRFPDISHLLSECSWKAKMWAPWIHLDVSSFEDIRFLRNSVATFDDDSVRRFHLTFLTEPDRFPNRFAGSPNRRGFVNRVHIVTQRGLCERI